MQRRYWLPLLAVLGMGIGIGLLALLGRLPGQSAKPGSVQSGPPPGEAASAESASLETPVPSGSASGVAEGPAAGAPPGPTRAVGTPDPLATPLALHGYFVNVVPGDTLWAIAIEANIPMEAIIAANPTINPDVLLPGQKLLIPDPASPFVEVAPGTGPTPELTAYVATDELALNLRASPDESLNVITALPPGTPLNVVGRTEDNFWLQVIAASGERGWVMTQFVTLRVDVSAVPVTAPGNPTLVAQLPPTAAPPTIVPPTEGAAATTPTAPPPPTPLPPSATPLSLYPTRQSPGGIAATGGPLNYPYISNITDTAREIYARGQQLGNRPDVFSKVGDSITVASAFLTPIGRDEYDLRDYAYLGPAIAYFSGTVARTDNSFANTSLAAKGGWSAFTVLNPGATNHDYCLPDELPLVCEYRLVRPSVALIMLGTNDVPGTSPKNYEEWMRQTVETSIDMGVIPVLSTIPEFQRPNVEGRVELLNGIIRDLSAEYDVPLWDYHAALDGLPNDGLSSDGVHPSWQPSPGPADFTAESLQNGMTVRNLTALQALDAVWRNVIRPV